jgi:chromosome segregation ATPase
MKNQLDLAKKEVEKLQGKSSADNSQMMILKQDRVKLEQLLKKATLENNKETAPQHNMNDQELKRLQAQNQILETQVKDSSQKITNLEAKLVEALKPQKTAASGDEGSKVKVTQLENSVKKLTQDLLATKNQVSEEKKETNKLRQEKTALQNQLDKLKKEADKAKPASPKKPGGKAA